MNKKQFLVFFSINNNKYNIYYLYILLSNMK